MTGGNLDALWPSSLFKAPETCNGFCAKAFSLSVETELAALYCVDGPSLRASFNVLLRSEVNLER